MARTYKQPTTEQVLNNIDKSYKDTINKVLDIQNILFVNPPKDKRFNKYMFDYIVDYVNIINLIDKDDIHYNDELLQKDINNLYNKIFKHRRY